MKQEGNDEAARLLALDDNAMAGYWIPAWAEVSEANIVVNGVSGVDLNGDGDATDTDEYWVMLIRPNDKTLPTAEMERYH